MSNDLKNTIKQLERKLKLSKQALKQSTSINKNYDDALKLLKQREHFTSTVIESNKNAIIAINEKQIVTIFNKSAEEMFGYSKQEMLHKDSLHNIIPKHFFHQHQKALTTFLTAKQSYGAFDSYAEFEGKRKDDTTFPIRIGFGIEIEKNGIIVVANIEDITFEKKVQNELKEQYAYLQTIVDGVDDPIMVIKKDYTIETMNSALRKSIKDLKVADQANPKCYEVSHHRSTPCDGLEHPCPLRDVLKTKSHMNVMHNHYTVDGNICHVELSVSPLFDKDENCIGIIELAKDMTSYIETQNELQEQKSILAHQAHHDALTGLPNRVLFNDRLKQAIEKAKRNNLKVALLFIDLDRFKEINDSLGHDTGDEVLKTVASRVRELLRDEDTLARLGGDEFTIILEDLTQAQDASLIARKILETLSKMINVDDNVLYISSSIGISIYPDDGENTQNLLKFADSAMYRAKDEGRNNYQFYNPTMTELAFERVVMEANLRKALEKEEFIVYYQPQINGVTNKLIGMEALVRWQHPTKGLIFPNEFIPIAELTGHIVKLDRYVMRTAMAQLVKWYKDGLNPGILAMNLSVKQLKQTDFIEMFKNLIKEVECKPEWLEFEVTEGQIMSNPEEAIKILQNIRDIGVNLAVDDFGTGYSSLAYLKKLPIDRLKIDREFIKDLPKNEEDSAITKTIIALGQSMNLKVIAEGVETKEQRDFIVQNGCEDIQGYYYSKSIPADEMKVILLEGLYS